MDLKENIFKALRLCTNSISMNLNPNKIDLKSATLTVQPQSFYNIILL